MDFSSTVPSQVSWIEVRYAGDTILVSKDGTRRIRFDIKRPHPHQSPHAHVEELKNGRWKKSGPIYPRDVPGR
jgi:hypothetical protein